MNPLRCGYCAMAAPYAAIQATYVINGQSVCDEHVDRATEDFGRSLHRLQMEQKS